MKKADIEKGILTSFLDDGISDLITLRLICNQKKYIDKIENGLVKDGILTRKKRFIKRNYKKYSIPYYTITVKGLQYLIDNYSDNMPWLKCIEQPVPSVETFSVKSHTSVYKALKNKHITTMLKEVGVRIINSKKETDLCSFSTLIENAKDQYKKHNGNIMDENEEEWNGTEPIGTYYPFDFMEDKYILSEEDKAQYRFQTHSGILTSRSNSYFVHHTNKRGWSANVRGLDRSRNQLSGYIKSEKLTPEMFDQLNRGIVFCSNIKEWAQILTDPDNQRGNTCIGDLMSHAYALPIRREAIQILSYILQYNDDTSEFLIKMKILPQYSKFTETGEKIIELKCGNSEAFVGLDMDIVKLEYFIAEVEREPEREYTVICSEWQTEYFKKILPKKINYFIINI